MTEEISTNPEDSLIDSPADSGVEQTDDDTSTNAPDDTGLPVDDSEEVEHEGQKYKVPKALKPALMMQADYTRKTQELAEQRRSFEAERSYAQQLTAEDMQHLGRFMAANERVQQFEQVNWQQISDADPVQAQKLWIEYQQTKDLAQQLNQAISSRNHQRNLEAQHKRAKQFEEIKGFVANEIKDWSPQLDKQLLDFAKADGWTEGEVQNLTLPQFKSIYRAFKADQLLKKQSTPAQATAKPVPQVGTGKATAKKDPSQMTDSEFASWRKSQIRQRYK